MVLYVWSCCATIHLKHDLLSVRVHTHHSPNLQRSGIEVVVKQRYVCQLRSFVMLHSVCMCVCMSVTKLQSCGTTACCILGSRLSVSACRPGRSTTAQLWTLTCALQHTIWTGCWLPSVTMRDAFSIHPGNTQTGSDICIHTWQVCSIKCSDSQ